MPKTGKTVKPVDEMERFSIECHSTNTKVITAAIRTKINVTRNQSELKLNTPNRLEARENASDQVTIGFSFPSDWLRGWREFSRPITEHSEAKPMQSRITFDTQLKIALKTKARSFH